jgi:predicted dehydrogenase
MKNTHYLSRRKFVGNMLGGVLAAGLAPQFISSRLLASATAPSNKIQLGHIGLGLMGMSDLRTYLAQTSDIAASVALCDPFKSRREKGAEFVTAAQPSNQPKLYADFRELLADKSIDAVVVATPDHWHVPIGLAAMRAGKHVNIQKPLGMSLNQNKAMFDACKKHNRIFHYGTQQRSIELCKRGVELVLNGYIGDLQHVDVWAPQGGSGGSLAEIPVPEGLDYELYIGPAPMKPCAQDRLTHLASWYCSDYSIGFIAGWGAHPLDIAVWGMDADLAGPYSITATGNAPTPNALFNNIATWQAELKFANGVTMDFTSNGLYKKGAQYWPDNTAPNNGTTFIGSKGWVSISRSGLSTSNPEWRLLRQCEGNRRVRYHNKFFRAFVEAVRDGTPSVAPIEDAIRSDAMSHLSQLSIQTGQTIHWDHKKYELVGASPELKARMDVPVRGDWMKG